MSKWWGLMGIATAVIVVLGLAHVVAARPWNSAASAACGESSARHLAAQVAFLESGTDSSSDLGQARDTTFAELGMACGWEEAQAADMAAYVAVLESGGSLPSVDSP